MDTASVCLHIFLKRFLAPPLPGTPARDTARRYAGTCRQDRAECWPQLLEELRAHVAEHPEPDPAVWALAGGRGGAGWEAGCRRSLLFGPPPPPAGAAQRAALQLRARLQRQQQQGRASPTAWDAELQEEEEESWLGEEEARHMEVRECREC